MFVLLTSRTEKNLTGEKMSKKYSECPLYNHNTCKDTDNPNLCAIVRKDKVCLKKQKDIPKDYDSWEEDRKDTLQDHEESTESYVEVENAKKMNLVTKKGTASIMDNNSKDQNPTATKEFNLQIPCTLAERVEAYASANNAIITGVVIEALDTFLREQQDK
jgi:hypothetical protein